MFQRVVQVEDNVPPGLHRVSATPNLAAAPEVERSELRADTVLPDGVLGHVACREAQLQVVMKRVMVHPTAVIADDDPVNMLLSLSAPGLLKPDVHEVRVGFKAVVHRLPEC